MSDSLASAAAPAAGPPRLWTLVLALFVVTLTPACAGIVLGLGVAMNSVSEITASGGDPADAGSVLDQSVLLAALEAPGLKAGLSVATSAVFGFVALLAARLSPQPL